MKTIFKNIYFFSLSVLISLFDFAFSKSNLINFKNSTIEKVRSKDINYEEMLNNEIIIVLDTKNSKKGDIKKLFRNINYKEIVDLTKSYTKYNNTKKNFRRIIKMVLEDSDKNTFNDTINQLENMDCVYSIEPNYSYELCTVPNDYSSSPSSQYSVELLDLDKAWNFTTGNENVKVGVIDTGIKANHPDLSDNINRTLSTSFSNVFEGPFDEIKMHGTEVAGVIGAVGNNGYGVTGVNWKVSLVSLNVYEENDDNNVRRNIEASNIISALDYANQHDIKILNASIGFDEEISVALEQAIENYDGLFICAVGNAGKNVDEIICIPSQYQCDNLISVGAIDQNDEICSFSNYGVNTVNIYSYGKEINTTYMDDQYYSVSGTFFSAPQVAGVAALLLSIKSDLTPSQIKNAILYSAKTITIHPTDNTSQSVKKLNAFNAVEYIMRNYCNSLVLDYNDKCITDTIGGTSPYIFDKNMFVKLNVQNAYNYGFAINCTRPISVTLYNSDLDVVPITTSYTNGNTQIEFTKNLNVDSYYLKVELENDDALSSATVNISGESHNHVYNQWIYKNNVSHIEACECGLLGTITKAHSVKISEIVNNRAICLDCNRLLNLNNDIATILSNNIKYSTNGSYILPSGIVMLLDEDVESYLNGTLVFYSSDKVKF